MFKVKNVVVIIAAVVFSFKSYSICNVQYLKKSYEVMETRKDFNTIAAVTIIPAVVIIGITFPVALVAAGAGVGYSVLAGSSVGSYIALNGAASSIGFEAVSKKYENMYELLELKDNEKFENKSFKKILKGLERKDIKISNEQLAGHLAELNESYKLCNGEIDKRKKIAMPKSIVKYLVKDLSK